jgi:adenylosuccinate lyase
MREGKSNNLLEALAGDDRIPFKRAELDALIGNPIEFTGDAREQVGRVVAIIEGITKSNPGAAAYKPSSIR